MKDAGLFFFEDDDSVLFVRPAAPFHGGKGVLGSCTIHLVFTLALGPGTPGALQLGQTCAPSACCMFARQLFGFDLFGFALACVAPTPGRVLDLHRRGVVGSTIATTFMDIIFMGKQHGRVWVRGGLGSRDGGWLGNGDDRGHGGWTTRLEPTATECGLEEGRSEEQDLLVRPVTKQGVSQFAYQATRQGRESEERGEGPTRMSCSRRRF